MRVTENMRYDQIRDNLGQNRSEMSLYQNQAATQKRVTKPSDDPVASTRVLNERLDLIAKQQYEKSLNYALNFLNYTDSSLAEVSDQLVRCKELAVAQANDAGSNEVSRRVVGTEVKQIYEQIVRIGNRKLGDRYIFGGYKTTVSPFDVSGKYKGDTGEMLINVDKGAFVAMNIPGSKVFMGEGLSSDGISHSTTEQPTTVEQLEDFHKKDKISPELEHKQRIRQKENNEIPEAKMRGLASVKTEDGEDEMIIDRLGPAYSKGINVFKVIKDLEVGLNTNDKTTIQDNLERLDEAISQVVLARSQIGARVTTLEGSRDSLSAGEIASKESISRLEDADIFEVISDINRTENTLNATLKSSEKLLTPSLMDFLK